MNLKTCKSRCLNTLFLTVTISLVVLFSTISCKSVKRTIGNPEVYLYKDQASLMDGTYFIDPYQTNGDYKLLTDIFNLDEAKNSDKVDLKFLDNENLQISYTDGLVKYTKIIKGKMKNGAFRYKYRNFPFGIPLLFFSYQFKVHHIALGNDDNIIITEYDSRNTQLLFSIFSTTKTENIYYFDRQLK